MQTGRVFAVGLGCLALVVGAASAPAVHAQGDGCPNAGLRTGASAGLPDCRALELVSPADKVGGTGVGVWYGGPGAAGSAGNAGYGSSTDATVERFAVQGTWGAVLTDSAFSFANDWALAQRTASGWASRPGATRGGYGNQSYRAIGMSAANETMSLTTWRSNGGILRLFPEMESWSGGAASGNPAFVRDWEQGRWDLFGVTDPTQNPAMADDALDSTAVSADGSYAVGSGRIRGLAGAGDPTHVDWADGAFVSGSKNVYLFDVSDGLTDAFPAPDDRRRSLVNVCTAGTAIPARVEVSPGVFELAAQSCPPKGEGRDAALISPRGGDLGRPVEQAISRDGARVFFMSPDSDNRGSCSGVDGATACPAQLYVSQRNVDGSVTTRWISRSRSVPAGGGAFGGGPIAGQEASLLDRALFEGASRDGSRVFFRSRSPLTPDDPNGGCGAPCTAGGVSRDSSDLYMYELAGGPDGDPATPDGDPGEGTLTRITAGPTGGSDCNSQFAIDTREYTDMPSARFVSEDGGRVYFVCDLPLTDGPGASNGTITSPSPSPVVPGPGFPIHTAANLYLYEAAKPVAERWRFVAQLPRSTAGGEVASCATTAARSGESLSAGPVLTQIVATNCVRGTSDGAFVTFWTDGRLTGDDDLDGVADIYAYDATADELTRITRAEPGASGDPYACVSALCHGDGGIGGGGPLPALGVATDPAVAGERLAFFQSRSRLVVEDTDDAYDVYRWKRAPGQPEGELSLLTPGDSSRDGQMYKGNDRSGRNVFFATRDRLSWQDHDAVLDVYSARVGGGIPAPVEPPACAVLAGACHGPGGTLAGTAPTTDAVGGQSIDPGVRARLAVRGLSRAQRRRAARRGVVVLRVRVSRPGRVVAVARARLGRRVRVRVVGRAVGRLSRPGAGTLRVRLNRSARRRLGSGRGLRVAVRVRTPGALTRTMRFTLRRSGR